MARVFTLEEANELVPQIKNLFTRIGVMRKNIYFMKENMTWLENFWGDEIYNDYNPDKEKFIRMSFKLNDLSRDLRNNIKQFDSMGCLLKDIEHGLVDFYSIHKGELIFLCWKYGEEKISHWHPTNSGFNERKPINSLEI